MVSNEEVLVPKDIRFDVPLFTVEEAAHHLGLPRTTLQAWTRRQAGPAPLVHRIVDPDSPRAASLPFVAVVEAHMLRGFRDLGLSAQGLRVSVARLRQDLGDEYALATRRVATHGVEAEGLPGGGCHHRPPVRVRPAGAGAAEGPGRGHLGCVLGGGKPALY